MLRPMPATADTPERESAFPWPKFIVGGVLMIAGPGTWLLTRTFALQAKLRSIALPDPDGADTTPPRSGWDPDPDLLGASAGILLTIVGFALVSWSFVQYEQRKASRNTDGPWR